MASLSGVGASMWRLLAMAMTLEHGFDGEEEGCVGFVSRMRSPPIMLFSGALVDLELLPRKEDVAKIRSNCTVTRNRSDDTSSRAVGW